jgi:hypothetical protein
METPNITAARELTAKRVVIIQWNVMDFYKGM